MESARASERGVYAADGEVTALSGDVMDVKSDSYVGKVVSNDDSRSHEAADLKLAKASWLDHKIGMSFRGDDSAGCSQDSSHYQRLGDKRPVFRLTFRPEQVGTVS
jgi:hypothetical protein